MMLIIVILALASIIGVGYFITTLVFYLKKDENGNRLGIMKFFWEHGRFSRTFIIFRYVQYTRTDYTDSLCLLGDRNIT